MICCCALAGTSACNTCNRKGEFENKNNSLFEIPFTDMQTGKKLIEVEIAIRRLNERIDEILGEQE